MHTGGRLNKQPEVASTCCLLARRQQPPQPAPCCHPLPSASSCPLGYTYQESPAPNVAAGCYRDCALVPPTTSPVFVAVGASWVPVSWQGQAARPAGMPCVAARGAHPAPQYGVTLPLPLRHGNRRFPNLPCRPADVLHAVPHNLPVLLRERRVPLHRHRGLKPVPVCALHQPLPARPDADVQQLCGHVCQPEVPLW